MLNKTLIACMIVFTINNSIKSVDLDCNQDLLKTFKVGGTMMEKSRVPTPMEKAYCRRNRETCCTEQNILSINNYFAKGVKSFKAKMEVIEELFSLFKGKKFVELVETIKEQDHCTNIVKDLFIEINNTKYDFFSTIYQNIKLDHIANMLLDVETYIKKNIWFHGDIICSICNPKHQEHYKFREGGSTFHSHLTTCFEIMEEREFEVELLDLYENYISKVVELVNCGTDDDDKENESETEKLANDITDDTKLVSLNAEAIEKLRSLHTKCVADKQLKTQECQEYCSKNMRIYNFPIPNFFRNMQVALNVLFEALAEADIGEFYEEIKGEEWKLGVFDEPVSFFEDNSLVEKFKVNDTQWVYSASEGDNMYREIMSKKFTNAILESIQSFLISAVLSLGLLWFI